MPQITLYIDAETAARMKKAAKSAGMSQSRWVAELVRSKAASEWPVSVARLGGAWRDLETTERSRKRAGKDVPREPS